MLPACVMSVCVCVCVCVCDEQRSTGQQIVNRYVASNAKYFQETVDVQGNYRIWMRENYVRAFVICSVHLCAALVALTPSAHAIKPRTCSSVPTHCFASPYNTPSVRAYIVQHTAAAGRVCEDDSRVLLNLPLRVTKRNTLTWAPHERCR